MRRREFIAVLGGAAAWPLTARSQQPALPTIGFLNSASPDAFAPYVAGFLQGLRDAGYIDGQNVKVEYRWGYGQYDRLSQLAAELVGQQVAVIVASGGEPSVMAAKAATNRTPIVFGIGGDPVKLGLVAAAGGGELAKFIDRGKAVARRQCHEQIAARVEERVGCNYERIGLMLLEGCESRIEVTVAACVHHYDLSADVARRFLHFDLLRPRLCIVRIDQHCDHCSFWHQFSE